uniref:Uncharacterized protein n=3 Tax=Ostreococcus mediterraneus TaxID=1486918 RepID=A0A6U0DV69_9CHLO
MSTSAKCAISSTASLRVAKTSSKARRAATVVTRAEGGWKPMAVTAPNLRNNLDGKTTRNIDGKVYTIEAKGEEITVTDKFGKMFASRVNKAGVIEADMSAAIGSAAAAAGGADGDDVLDFASMNISELFGFNAKYKIPEVVNGRAAMLGAVFALFGKFGGHSVAEQVFSAGGFFNMLLIMGFTTAATLAPFALGKTTLRGAIPDENASYPDEKLPTLWTSSAEAVNGKVAMVVFALALITGN